MHHGIVYAARPPRSRVGLLALGMLMCAGLGIFIPPSSAAATTVVLVPEADAKVVQASPNKNFGSVLSLAADGAPVVRSYLRFAAPASGTDTVAKAVLRLWVINGSQDAPTLHTVDSVWTEKAVTWATKPMPATTPIGDQGLVASQTWVEYDVTTAVVQRRLSFALVSVSGDAMTVSSREASAALRPQLLLTMQDVLPPADTTPPETVLDSAPEGEVSSTSATVTFHASEPATFRCRLDDAAAQVCSSPVSFSGLAEGPHTVQVVATDTAGNVDPTPATAGWTVVALPPADTTPPDTVLDSAPEGEVSSTSATVTFHASEPATFRCRLDDAAAQVCSSPVSFSGLAEGPHTVQVVATDTAGNVDPTPATAGWTVRAPVAVWQAMDVAATVGLQVKTGTEGHLCVADADADGRSDVVLSMHGSALWPLMRQNADGSFAPVFHFGPVTDRHSCTSGDFASVTGDGSFGPPDGRTDFYTTTGACQGNCTKAYPNHLYVQKADGSYVDGAVPMGVANPHGRGRNAVTVDLDVDGADDIYLTNEPSSLYTEPNRTYLNQRTGLFEERVDQQATIEVSSKCVRTADFNADGRADVVLCGPTSTYFFANTAQGLVDIRASLGIPASLTIRDVAWADFNADGHLDLATVHQLKLQVRLWTTAATPYSKVHYERPLAQGRSIAVGDLFGTGRGTDIYVVDGWSSSQARQSGDWILRWSGSGSTASFQSYAVPAPADTGATSAPLNGQGDQVSIVPNWGGTGRGLAIVSNGLFGAGVYQAITMQQTWT